MERYTIVEYGFIIVSALTITMLLMFATPFGKILGKSVTQMALKQKEIAEEKTNNEAFEQNFNEMTELFDSTGLLQPGLYKTSSVEPVALHQQLLNEKYVAIDENGLLYSSKKTTSMNGDYIVADGVKTITANTFMNCNGLTLIRLNASCEKIQGSVLQGCQNLKTFIAGSELTQIGDTCFYNCPKLETVYLNKKLTEIGNNAFRDCPKLTTIHFSGTMADWDYVNKYGNWKDDTLKQVICSNGIIEL